MRWSLAKRLGFRWLCAYVLLFFYPFPLAYLPFTGTYLDYHKLWHPLLAWMGRVLAGREPSLEFTGSGDTTASYLLVLLYAALATVATAIWSWLARRRTEHVLAHAWLRAYARYGLAATMLSYGFAKVFPTQFIQPSPDVLVQRFGDASPMRLLWTFMGFSPGYTAFAGALEVLGGLLLLARQTTTLGALVVAGVMTNVFAMNLAYDVPVKQYSLHLALVAVFLAAPDARRLLRFFILNQATEPAPLHLPPAPRRRWLRRTFTAWRVAFSLTLVGWFAYQGWKDYEKYVLAPPGPLHGAWEVETFKRDGVEVPPLRSETTRWRFVSFNRWRGVTIRRMDESQSARFRAKFDDATRTVTLTGLKRYGSDFPPQTLAYAQPDPHHLTLSGTFDGVRIEASLRLRDDKWLLMNRGFRWVNEFPFNR